MHQQLTINSWLPYELKRRIRARRRGKTGCGSWTLREEEEECGRNKRERDGEKEWFEKEERAREARRSKKTMMMMMTATDDQRRKQLARAGEAWSGAARNDEKER